MAACWARRFIPACIMGIFDMKQDAMAALRLITSLQNETVKLIRSLEQRKARKETGLFVAEGAKVVATARDQGWEPSYLLIEEEAKAQGIVGDLVAWAQTTKAQCLRAAEAVLSKLSTRDNPQNVIGVFHQRWMPEKDVDAKGVWVVLEEVRDPGNLGTIIRTADAVGARGVILIGTCCDAYAREVVRASMGSIFSVPLVKMSHESFASFMKGWPGEIIGTHLSSKADYRRSYQAPTLLVMGSEGPGLSDKTAQACTTLVKIPMVGGADSLNLAMATALMLYEIRRPDLKL